MPTVKDYAAQLEVEPSLLDSINDREPVTPKKSPGKQAAETKGQPYRPGKYKKSIAELYTYVGMGLMFVDPVCAEKFVEASDQCAEAWDKLAAKSPRVRKALDSLLTGSDLTALFLAHLPILMGIIPHHLPVVKEMFDRFTNRENEETPADDII